MSLLTAATSLSRLSRAQVVPENGAFATVNLTLSQATLPEAVEALANKARRDWTTLYVLRGGFGDGRIARESSEAGTAETNGAAQWERRGPPGDPAEFEKRFQAQLETMTPEERKQAEEARKRFEEMRNLSPEERRKRFGEMASRPEMQQRMQDRMLGGIKNTAPDQRVERDQRMERRRRENAR